MMLLVCLLMWLTSLDVSELEPEKMIKMTP